MLGEDSPGYIVLLEQLSQLFRVTRAFACDKREGRSCLRVETSDQAVHSCHNLNLREDVDVLKVVDLVMVLLAKHDSMVGVHVMKGKPTYLQFATASLSIEFKPRSSHDGQR